MSTKDSRGRSILWQWRSISKMRFKLLMKLLVQYGVILTMGLTQGFPLSPVLYSVYTKGLADLNNNGLSRVLTLADDGLIYKTASDISAAVTAVQEQLEKVSHWCQETESEINPSTAQTQWCTSTTKQ